jgi:hypothetical protein
MARTRAAANAAEFMGHISMKKPGRNPALCNSTFQNAHFANRGSGLSDNVKAGVSALASLKP